MTFTTTRSRWTRVVRAYGRDGYVFELIDLRDWRAERSGLQAHLEQFDAFLLTGGNPYHLRSLMKLTGADQVLTDVVRAGAVYAGAERGGRRRRADASTF